MSWLKLSKGIMPPRRFPCGQRHRVQTRAKRQELDEAEKLVVLSQPHRKGSRSQLAESNLGRFIMAQFSCDGPRVQEAIWGETIAYSIAVSRWRRIRGIPSRENLRFDDSSYGAGDLDGGAAALSFLDKYIASRDAAMSGGLEIRLVVTRDLILFDRPPAPSIVCLAKSGLWRLWEGCRRGQK